MSTKQMSLERGRKVFAFFSFVCSFPLFRLVLHQVFLHSGQPFTWHFAVWLAIVSRLSVVMMRQERLGVRITHDNGLRKGVR